MYRVRETNPEKVIDYRNALADGAVALGPVLTRQQAMKLTEMGIDIPEGVTIKQGGRSPRPVE